ncbi:MAG: hypothetical protein A3E25_20900 [Burkholderiales bacterium RIFCSPHIGHO2_12_FULL_69_20]|nr:MAG: hypothetical protein A3E25_20900 [Burkholderiales bacterium RIFCSPHIGHO2_12_FULL_69_20]
MALLRFIDDLATDDPAQAVVDWRLLARRNDHWPEFFDLCPALHRAGPGVHAQLAAQRLAAGEFTVPRACTIDGRPAIVNHKALAERAAQLARLMAGWLRGGQQTQPDDLSLRLLHEAIIEGCPVPALLRRCRSATVPVLLVQVEPGQADRHVVADLTVWALPLDGASTAPLLAPAPASLLVQYDKDFETALERAGHAILRRQPRQSRGYALVWDLRPRTWAVQFPLLDLFGDSAGTAFALAGLLALPPEEVKVPLRRHLAQIDGPLAAVSAAIGKDLRKLERVGKVEHKLGILLEVPAAHARVTRVFVAPGCESREAWKLQPQACATLNTLIRNIALHIAGELTPEQGELQRQLLADGDAVPTEKLIDTVAGQPTTTLRGYLLRRYAHWAQATRGKLHLNFVPLDVSAAAEGPRGERRRVRLTSLQDVLGESGASGDGTDADAATRPLLPRADAWLLIGEPGGGKTTLLRRFEMDHARHALRCMRDGLPMPPVCVWLPLGEFDPSATSPMDDIERLWKQENKAMPRLAQLAGQHPVRLILDGLNEIKAPDSISDTDERADFLRRARRRLADAVRRAGFPMAAPIYSVRVLDRGIGLGLTAHDDYAVAEVELAEWDDERMQQYCQKRLTIDQAAALWKQLQGSAELKAFCARPMILSGQCDLVRDLGLTQAVTNRARLFALMVWAGLAKWREPLRAAGLLSNGDVDLVGNRAHWLQPQNMIALPTGGALVSGLDRQGDALRRRNTLECPVTKVADWLRHDAALRARWLKAVQDLGLGHCATGSRTWRFSHQLWQEFFAGRGLLGDKAAARPGPVVRALAAPVLVDTVEQVLARLRSSEGLPLPEVSPLEETFKFAVQAVGDPAPWIERLIRKSVVFPDGANLALAGRAAVSCVRRLPSALLARLRMRLLARSTDPDVDLRLRLEAGLILGELGDNIRYDDRQCHLIPNEDHWIAIDGGPCRIGSDADDPDAFDNEQPSVDVVLRPYSIAFAPVTRAEYRRFIAHDTYADARWWSDSKAYEARFRSEGRDGVLSYWDRRGTYGLHPVTGVGFAAAQAYCRWLTDMANDGWTYCLPTEAEWEFAARGPNRNHYAWGSQPPTIEHCNCDLTRLWKPSPIGIFPRGDRIVNGQHLTDFAGNVWEWTCSYHERRLNTKRLIILSRGGYLTLRGGSAGYPLRTMHAAYRDGSFEDQGYHHDTGFRMIRRREL